MSSMSRIVFRSVNSLKPFAPLNAAAQFHQSSATFESHGNVPDTPTHTGQKFEANDLRLGRFEVAPKQVNSQWAINLIKEVPPKPVKSRIAVCEGGPSEALGHPKVYINLDEPGNHSCIYCGLRYFKDTHH